MSLQRYVKWALHSSASFDPEVETSEPKPDQRKDAERGNNHKKRTTDEDAPEVRKRGFHGVIVPPMQ